MVKIFRLTQEGNLPEYNLKNSKYWLLHDLQHFKESFIWCIKKAPVLLLATILGTLPYGAQGGWMFEPMAKLGLYIFGSLFLIALIIRVILYKGYNVGKNFDINHKGTFVPHNFNETRLVDLENRVKHLSKLLKK